MTHPLSGGGKSTPLPTAVALCAEDLRRHYALRGAGAPHGGDVVRAVDGVSFKVRKGETFGLVGESGSGKSTLARLLLRLEHPTSGRVVLDGKDLMGIPGRDLRRERRRIQLVFQDAFGALNRRKTVSQIIGLPLRVHFKLTGEARDRRIRDLLEVVGLGPELAACYPHQLSGGQCQRVGIARALALEPEFIVLDEAVSAVDVSIRAQILNLLRELQEQLTLTYLFISHDLAIVRYMSTTVAVMYQGRIVESGPRDRLFHDPLHPYTRSLMSSIPVPDPAAERERVDQAAGSAGDVGAAPVTGCRYRPRCPIGALSERCEKEVPPLVEIAPEHRVACHFPQSSAAVSRLPSAARLRGGATELPSAELANEARSG